jgi:DNA-binding response OmpR family regulator
MEKQRILIIDDDENIAELISLYLIKECFDTKVAYDGEAALNMVDTYNPDLILLDLMLPGIDGYEVCQRIRKVRNTPVIILSAKGEVFDKVLGLKIGADDYIVKPFDSNELVARVRAVLRRTETVSAGDDAHEEQPPIDSNHTGDFVVTTQREPTDAVFRLVAATPIVLRQGIQVDRLVVLLLLSGCIPIFGDSIFLWHILREELEAPLAVHLFATEKRKAPVEKEVEFLNTGLESLGGKKMAQFVDENQDRKGKKKL